MHAITDLPVWDLLTCHSTGDFKHLFSDSISGFVMIIRTNLQTMLNQNITQEIK